MCLLFDPEHFHVGERQLVQLVTALARCALQAVEAEARQAMQDAASASPEQKVAADQAVAELAEKQKAAAAALAAAVEELKRATDAAQPRDIVDIIVAEPITITRYLRLLAGLTSFISNLWRSHFAATGPEGMLASRVSALTGGLRRSAPRRRSR